MTTAMTPSGVTVNSRATTTVAAIETHREAITIVVLETNRVMVAVGR